MGAPPTGTVDVVEGELRTEAVGGRLDAPRDLHVEGVELALRTRPPTRARPLLLRTPGSVNPRALGPVRTYRHERSGRR